MIFVGGVPFQAEGSSSSSESEGSKMLIALMDHPILESASYTFNSIPERKFSASEGATGERVAVCKWVYVFQREYATVDPNLVDFAGTDEATTCVGLIIRNHKSGMTSVAHLDSSSIVEVGLFQMLSLVVDQDSNDFLEVHLIGCFDDSSPQHMKNSMTNHKKSNGYSFPLCAKIVEVLHESSKKFHLQTLHVLKNNTRKDSEGNAYPIFHGFLVNPSTGTVTPAGFDGTSRCPDEIVRKIRVTTSFEDPSWNGRLLETYDTITDQFVIAPCKWTKRQLHIAEFLQSLPDAEFLLTCSTSPSAEAPDFVMNQRRTLAYMIQHPDWKETFPLNQPRVFERTPSGEWKRLTNLRKANAEPVHLNNAIHK